MSKTYLTAPVDSTQMPKGIPYIIGNEAAERFSFYGMKAILMVYMTQHLLNSQHELAPLSEARAMFVMHEFGSATYLFPLIVAFFADWLFGKYNTILWLSLVYCLGHGLLALGDTSAGMSVMSPEMWLYAGLGLIAFGSGGIKPCVTAHVGDQFGPRNQHLMQKVFGLFYVSINIGAAVSSLLTPVLLANYGPAAAFGVPGILMALATLVFWLGRNKFVHVPASGNSGFFSGLTKGKNLKSVLWLLPLFLLFTPMFWAVFDQTASKWVLQAAKMDRNVFGFEIGEAQINAVNPIMILIMAPLFAFVIYPAVGKFIKVTPLRKIAVGIFLTAAAVLVSAVIELMLADGQTPHIVWQLLAFAILTTAEVLISITGLEFAYTQAPKSMKSLVMGINMAGVALGNQFVALINKGIEKGWLPFNMDGANYWWFFMFVVLGTGVGFIVYAVVYRGESHIEDDAEAQTDAKAADLEL